MNTKDRILVPGIIETVGDAIGVLVKFRPNDVAFMVSQQHGSITMVRVEEVSINICGPGQEVVIKCLVRTPKSRQAETSWVYQRILFQTVTEAAEVVWPTPEASDA